MLFKFMTLLIFVSCVTNKYVKKELFQKNDKKDLVQLNREFDRYWSQNNDSILIEIIKSANEHENKTPSKQLREEIKFIKAKAYQLLNDNGNSVKLYNELKNSDFRDDAIKNLVLICVTDVKIINCEDLINQLSSTKYYKEVVFFNILRMFNQGNFDKVIEDLIKQFKAGDDSERNYILLAMSYLSKRKIGPLAFILEQGLNEFGNSAYLNYLTGERYRDLDIALAQEFYIKALRIDGGFLQAYFRLADEYLKEKKCDDAEKIMPQTLRNENINYKIYQARIFTCKGMKEQAKNMYSEVLALEPNNIIANYNLGYLYDKFYGQPELSIEYFNRLQELSSDEKKDDNYKDIIKYLKRKISNGG